jgi:hypothetical protein
MRANLARSSCRQDRSVRQLVASTNAGAGRIPTSATTSWRSQMPCCVLRIASLCQVRAQRSPLGCTRVHRLTRLA